MQVLRGLTLGWVLTGLSQCTPAGSESLPLSRTVGNSHSLEDHVKLLSLAFKTLQTWPHEAPSHHPQSCPQGWVQSPHKAATPDSWDMLGASSTCSDPPGLRSPPPTPGGLPADAATPLPHSPPGFPAPRATLPAVTAISLCRLQPRPSRGCGLSLSASAEAPGQSDH